MNDADLHLKFRAMKDAADGFLVERSTETTTAILAILSGTNHLQLGEPGVAKSYLVEVLTSMIGGGTLFKTLLTKQSMEEQLFGPLSLKALDDDRYCRKLERRLAAVDFGVVDEVYKGSAAIINSLLWIMNERQYENDGEVIDVPLISLFCTSNEGPQSGDLAAVHDRMHFKHIVPRLRAASSLEAMIEIAKKRQSVPVLVSIDEVRRAHALVGQVEIGEDVVKALGQLWTDLGAENIHPSDRKYANTIRVIQAAAFYAGRAKANVTDLSVLCHMLWDTPEQFDTVRRVVNQVSSPLENEAILLLVDLEAMSADVQDAIGQDNRSLMVRKCKQILTKLSPVNEKVISLRKRQRLAGTPSPKIDEANAKVQELAKELLSKGFNYAGNLQDLSKLSRSELAAVLAEGGVNVDP